MSKPKASPPSGPAQGYMETTPALLRDARQICPPCLPAAVNHQDPVIDNCSRSNRSRGCSAIRGRGVALVSNAITAGQLLPGNTPEIREICGRHRDRMECAGIDRLGTQLPPALSAVMAATKTA